VILLASQQAERMQTPVNGVCGHLPGFLRTKEIKLEIAREVSQCMGSYDEVALQSALVILQRFIN
jgi:hypothetical protein